MDHAEYNSTMVPPSSPGPGLGSTSNLGYMSQDNYPNLSQTNSNNKRQRQDSDDEPESEPSLLFKSADNFARFLIIKSEEDQPITHLSPFVIEKQKESIIGTPKSVKKLKNKTLLIETTRRAQTENLLKMKKFFNLKVTVSEHKTLNTSRGIIKDRALKGESEKDICDYLKNQGVIAVKRFTIKKEFDTIETNTLLLTFNSVSVPNSVKIFYRIIPVDIYVPNPLRCYNCQRFGHHESDCPADYASICEKCGEGGFTHLASACPNPVKCVNCGLDHLSRSNVCEVWKKEKEIMKVKVTRNVTYIEARKMVEQTPEVTFSKIVQSAVAKPELKTVSTQTSDEDKVITSSTKVLDPTPKKVNKSQTPSQSSTPKPKSTPQKPKQTTLANTSKVEQKQNRESRSKTRSSPRKKSQSPKKTPKERQIKLTRVQDESIKLDNKFNSLEQMEAEVYDDQKSGKESNK